MTRVLACGAFLKNTACLFDTATPQAPLWSGVHGDLSDPAACAALEHSVQDLLAQEGGAAGSSPPQASGAMTANSARWMRWRMTCIPIFSARALPSALRASAASRASLSSTTTPMQLQCWQSMGCTSP